MTSAKEAKQKLRKEIWGKMQELGIARFPFPLKDRIPNFEGSDLAAQKVRELPEWEKTRIIVANPDFAQKKVRELALRDGKTLIMASPRLKEGYLLIDSTKVKGKEDIASSIKGAFTYGEKLKELPKPDLIITGCVAVDKKFYRLGKGGGYGDKEINTIHKLFGKIPVVTTVHDIQLVDEVPVEEGDTQVEIIVTPTKIFRSLPSKKSGEVSHMISYKKLT